MSDIFREVDEDLRRDQYKKLWDRFGPYVIGAAVLIVAVTAGFRGWEYWNERRAQTTGDQFITAIEASEAGNHEEAVTLLQEIVDSGSGEYPALAGFRLATEKASSGDESGAVAEFDAIAASNAPEELRNIARLRAALILTDSLTSDEMADRVGDLAQTGNPWRHTARELIGLTAWRSGELETARGYFSDLAADEETPSDLRQRSEVMLSLIEARLGQQPEGAGDSS